MFACIVAYQGGEHRILTGGCIVIQGNEIVHVGKDYKGEVDREVDAKDRLVTPGFINVHTHLSESPLDKSLLEDVGKRQFSLSALADLLPARGKAIDAEGRKACVDYSLAELIRTGTTTVMEIGGIGDYVADAAERAGLHAYIADGYRSGRWYTNNGRTVNYQWDEEACLVLDYIDIKPVIIPKGQDHESTPSAPPASHHPLQRSL